MSAAAAVWFFPPMSGVSLLLGEVSSSTVKYNDLDAPSLKLLVLVQILAFSWGAAITDSRPAVGPGAAF